MILDDSIFYIIDIFNINFCMTLYYMKNRYQITHEGY